MKRLWPDDLYTRPTLLPVEARSSGAFWPARTEGIGPPRVPSSAGLESTLNEPHTSDSSNSPATPSGLLGHLAAVPPDARNHRSLHEHAARNHRSTQERARMSSWFFSPAL
ncbi:hypothetical protein ABZP36_020720 [Zizania latifolia]